MTTYHVHLLEREMFQTKAAKKIKTHTVYVQKLYSENRVAYEIMWKNMVQTVRPQITSVTRCTDIASWITTDTHTQSEYVILRILLFHGSNGYAKVSVLHLYVKFLSCLLMFPIISEYVLLRIMYRTTHR